MSAGNADPRFASGGVVNTDSGETARAVECRQCDAFVNLPIEGGGRAIIAGALDGWEFDSDNGWRCPVHAESAS